MESELVWRVWVRISHPYHSPHFKTTYAWDFEVISSRFDRNELDTAGENVQQSTSLKFIFLNLNALSCLIFGLKCCPLQTSGMLL
jgi:hypothetical protein